jgi:hypothetical protein
MATALAMETLMAEKLEPWMELVWGMKSGQVKEKSKELRLELEMEVVSELELGLELGQLLEEGLEMTKESVSELRRAME